MRRVRIPSRLAAAIRKRPRRALAIAIPAALVVVIAAWRLLFSGEVPPPGPPTPAVVIQPAADVTLPPAPRPTNVVTFADGCMTAECHTLYRTSPRIHPTTAAADCAECHQADTGGHVYPLVAPVEQLCMRCHQTGAHSTVKHRALTEGGCTACHDPHVGTDPLGGLLNAPSTTALCARCHPGTEGKVKHKVYAEGRCEACHEVHGSDTASLLKGGSAASHCRTCHDQTAAFMAVAAHSHLEVEGSCLACHAAHASDHAKLLTAQPREQCITCHDDIGRTVAGAVISHDAVLKGDQCITCHEPHASSDPRMLRADQTPVCLGCHNKEVIAADGRKVHEMATSLANAPVVHGPVATGDCGACHAVHGGEHARLLKQVNPESLSGPLDVHNYALCFACHDRQLAVSETPLATQFRDGDKNLHASHLAAGERSRGCGACHAVHTSQRPRLIADDLAFEGSGWKMPMGFVLTLQGGSCSPGCHEPLSYKRTSPSILPRQPQGGTP